MKKTWKIVIGSILLIALALLVLHLLGGGEDFKLKEVEFTRDVLIKNNIEDRPEYDDIVYVGLESLGVDGVNVLIVEMDRSLQDKYEYNNEVSLEAYIVPGDKVNIFEKNSYMIVVSSKLSLKKAVEVIAHELIHLQQIESGKLHYEGNVVVWQGEILLADHIPYNVRPWEREAHAMDDMLEDLILIQLEDRQVK